MIAAALSQLEQHLHQVSYSRCSDAASGWSRGDGWKEAPFLFLPRPLVKTFKVRWDLRTTGVSGVDVTAATPTDMLVRAGVRCFESSAAGSESFVLLAAP